MNCWSRFSKVLQLILPCLLILTMLTTRQAFCNPMKNDVGYIYLPFTRAYQFPGTIRLGRNDYEMGIFSQTSLAFSKVFRSQQMMFVAFGPAFQPFIARINVGIVGVLGVEMEFLKIFRLRGEFNSLGYINRAYTVSEANLGLLFQY